MLKKFAMGDTDAVKTPKQPEKEKETLTESQVIPFSDIPETVRPKSEPVSDEVVSVIGESLHFKGELSADEDLIIEGKVEGTINQGKCSLTLRPNGRIIADVNATKIFVEGTVDGDLHATVSVTVRKSGVVTGNIVSPTVAIEEGATFNGSITMRTPKR
jgi:cytoskeletal protein CcmA (bactofilin family)